MLKRRIPLSVSTGHARPILEELVRLGGDLDLLWKQIGVRTPWRSILDETVTLLPATEFTRIYRAGAAELERRCCLRDGRRPMGKPAMDMLCYCVINCGTLREVIVRAAAFNTMMEDRGGGLRVEERGNVAHFTMDVPGRLLDSASLLIDLTGLSFYYQLFSWLIGCRLPLLMAGVAHPEPSKPHPLLDFFGIPLQFTQPVNTLVFEASYLERRVVRSHTELQNMIDYFPFDLSPAGSDRTAVSDQVRLLFLDSLQCNNRIPELNAVAQLFHMSPATLRRHLNAEKISYSSLRANCQHKMADYLLEHTDLSMEDIAARLGLGSDRAFRRAFREWSGDTPAAYRDRVRHHH